MQARLVSNPLYIAKDDLEILVLLPQPLKSCSFLMQVSNQYLQWEVFFQTKNWINYLYISVCNLISSLIENWGSHACIASLYPLGYLLKP